ncbi:hypothetical protein EYF80_061087 [Liparis tanakae]|uniref:Uncharacterized protein n=1 Tax=Liparis tanakae TaxID=230148 RepID=A0A4Z2EJ36_9TELE|nr:hypothetical protein EYF80_061087 [Liparis tanakae]
MTTTTQKEDKTPPLRQ